MKKFIAYYFDSFKGLSKEVWWLALVTLINRAGTMVIPFLSIYLTESEGLKLSDVGWVMTAFGIGSMIGTWIGGKLTDRIGFYNVMRTSLFFTGIGFLLFQYIHGFWPICIAILLLTVVADIFRPAMFVALSSYSKKENKTRSVTLIRLAINLGFSAGPAIGGLIITTLGYSGLFWVDGITCIVATLIFSVVLHPRKAVEQESIVNDQPISVFSDKVFIAFFFAMVLYSFVFLQLFSTIPVYFRQEIALSELTIGILMGMNGLIIFLFEMPLIKYLESTRFSDYQLIIFGTILTVATFVFFNLFGHLGLGFIVLAVIVISIGEMIALPFSNSFALKRAALGNQGEYMATYALAFSVSHILAHNFSMQSAEYFGYEITWWMVTGIGFLCLGLLFFTIRYWHKDLEK